jgi:hypothetical protein
MKNWKIGLGIIFSGIFFYFAFRNIEWRALWQTLVDVDYFIVFLTMIIVAAMLVIRGYRWSFFLKPIKKVGVVPLFWSTSIGFGVNNVLPARLGEVARAYSLHKKTDIPFGASFGSIVVERLYDTFSILFVFVVCLFVLDFPDISSLVGRSQDEIALLLGVLGAVLLGGVVLLKIRTEKMLSIAAFFLRPFSKKVREKIIGLMRAFISGLTQTTRPLEVVWVAFLSVMIWVISAFTVWLAVTAFGVNLNPSQTMTVLMAMVLAVSIPAAPGYAGTYHYFCSVAIMLVVEMPPEQALSIATLIHAANFIPQTALGLGALFFEGIRFSDVKKAKEQIEKQPSGGSVVD